MKGLIYFTLKKTDRKDNEINKAGKKCDRQGFTKWWKTQNGS